VGKTGLSEHNSMEGAVSDKPLTIAIVAGEVSGDILGAGLIKALRKRYPNAQFMGIGGPLMIAQGFKSKFPMERLSVMGLFEVLGRIFELVGIRRTLYRGWIQDKPDVFIGIDAPDFNLGLEKSLREAGIKTTHYVSPSVWAWRQKRVHKIAKAVDLMLTLFPFEAKFYKSHDIAVRFVGHPLADLIPMRRSKQAAQSLLGFDRDDEISADAPTLAILPGSRSGEIAYIGKSFIDAAKLLHAKIPNLQCVVPCVNQARYEQVEALFSEHGEGLRVKLVLGQSRDVMSASDVVLLASGTATLECMLLKRPMVVAYRVNRMTYWVMKRLLKSKYVSLPNLLADEELVPELIQDDASPEKIADALARRFSPIAKQALELSFSQLHESLQLGASAKAAEAVSLLIEGRLDAEQRASSVKVSL